MNKKTSLDGKKKLSGRPTLYNDALAQEICDTIAICTESLEKICEKYAHFPAPETIKKWRYKIGTFSALYARAKIHQAEIAIEEIRSQAEKFDYFIDQKGNKRIDPGSIARQSLIVSTEKWIASKIIPRIYGNMPDLEYAAAQNAQLREELLQLRAELDKKNKKEY